MDVDSVLHIDCKYENLGANDNDLMYSMYSTIAKYRYKSVFYEKKMKKNNNLLVVIHLSVHRLCIFSYVSNLPNGRCGSMS